MEEVELVRVWLLAVPAALAYCHALSSLLRPGHRRLLTILPVITLFSLLPFSFSTVHLRGISAFFLAWNSAFKLLLFAYDRGPLCDHNVTGYLSLPSFIAIAALPITVEKISPTTKRRPSAKTLLVFAVKGLLLGFIVSLYARRARFPRVAVLCFYCFHLYLALDLLLTGAAAVSLALLPAGAALKPQFSAPYLCSSLQEFWARGWNLAVSRILRAAVYDPVRAAWGSDCGRAAAFLVSGLMHEAMFYYLTLRPPTGEVTAFFVLHGVCTAAEIAAKKRRRTPLLPHALATVFTVGFVLATGLWLFLPQILRSDAEEWIVGEAQALVNSLFPFLSDPSAGNSGVKN